MGSTPNARVKLIALIAGGLAQFLVSLIINLSISILGHMPSFGGYILGGVDILFVAVYGYTVGAFGESRKLRTRNLYLAFGLGFAIIAFGFTISLVITFRTYDASLMLLGAVLLATAAYTSSSLWRRITGSQ